MKKILAIAALALTLTACGTTNPTPTVTVTETPTTDTLVYNSNEDLYLSDVRAANNYNLMDETDAALLEIGYQTCSVLDEGNTVTDLVVMLLGDNPTDSQMEMEAIIIGNAIEYFCPEYLYQIG